MKTYIRFYNNINSWQKEAGFVGKQFAICLNGKIVSTGYFETMWNRFPCWTNSIKFYPKDKERGEIGFLINICAID